MGNQRGIQRVSISNELRWRFINSWACLPQNLKKNVRFQSTSCWTTWHYFTGPFNDPVFPIRSITEACLTLRLTDLAEFISICRETNVLRSQINWLLWFPSPLSKILPSIAREYSYSVQFVCKLLYRVSLCMKLSTQFSLELFAIKENVSKESRVASKDIFGNHKFYPGRASKISRWQISGLAKV